MSRINIDDDIDHDPRFMCLKALKGEVEALGLITLAYRVAEAYYVPHRKPIPMNLFKLLPWAQVVLDTSVAEVSEDGAGILIMRSEEQFEWLITKHENGKRGGLAKASKALANLSEPVANSSGVLANASETYPLTPAPAPPLALTQNTKTKERIFENEETRSAGTELSLIPRGEDLDLEPNTKLKPSARGNHSPEGTNLVVSAYVKAFQARYGTRPVLPGKTQGQIKNLLRSIPVDRVVDMIQVYCQMDTPWFVTKRHDITTFIENLNPVAVALDTGDAEIKPKRKGIEDLIEQGVVVHGNA